METTKRRPQWLLDLGINVDAGRKPWLPVILAGPLLLLPVLVARGLLDQAGSDRVGPPGLEQVANALLAATIVNAFIMVLLGIVFYYLCLYAHEAWYRLPVDERLEMARTRLEQMDEVLERLDRRPGEWLPAKRASHR